MSVSRLFYLTSPNIRGTKFKISSISFCPYAVMIENENERLFTCMREGCLKVTCRQCHRVSQFLSQ